MAKISDYTKGYKDGMRYSNSKLIVEMYSAFVITLKDFIHYEDDEIETIIQYTASIWQDLVENNKDFKTMAQEAKERTGIDIMLFVNEKR